MTRNDFAEFCSRSSIRVAFGSSRWSQRDGSQDGVVGHMLVVVVAERSVTGGSITDSHFLSIVDFHGVGATTHLGLITGTRSRAL